MPELPEAEVVRRGIADHVLGARVTGVELRDHRSLKRDLDEPSGFVERITGRAIVAAVRRGKFIWLPLDGAGHEALSIHLGMSGQVLLRPVDVPDERHERIRIHLHGDSGPVQLRFVDQRLFGSLSTDTLVATDDGGFGGHWQLRDPNGVTLPEPTDELAWMRTVPSNTSHIARDMLDPELDVRRVAQVITSRSASIKSLILQQTIASGVGNIYADEALWLARIHPDTSGGALSEARVRALLEAVRTVMRSAVAEGGTSFDEQYKNVNGQSGYFEVSLNAYGRSGVPCPRCGQPIVRKPFANRSSHFCPHCQRKR